MLKELVKERLMAAADEIFALFESTITSYEEELSRTREEKEQHRQQLEAARKTQIVLHVEDVRQLIGRQEECPFIPQDESSNFKQDDPQPHHLKYCISQSGEECLLGPQEADLTNLPLTGFSVKTEDHEDKPQVNNLFAPLSDSDDIMSHSAEDENVDYTQEPLSSDTDCEDDVRQLIGHQEERPFMPQDGSSTLKQEYPQPPYLKDCISQSGEECFLGLQEGDFTNLPLTGFYVKTEDHEDKPQVDHLLAPLSGSDDITSHSAEDYTQVPLSSHTDCEGDMRTHTDNQHPECSEKKTCKKDFRAKMFCKKSNAQHMRTHMQEKPFRCSVCGNTFSQKATLILHMRTHTGEKPFQCLVCGNTFSLRHNLKLHMRTHTGEKPYICSVCCKKFSQKSNLTVHMRTHTQEKPFKCSVCCKTFSLKGTLTAHMRTHTHEKPFICSFCGDKFAQRANLKFHMRKHTG
ncbi:zinc finger protein 235-like isoform X2 [Nerophis ophidion]|uniref:zinc finger protein 235-like isoform X2 n=1 Tax=Nerophis ophidion TaxID=159077 RepID=UPI002ADFEC84|nr:zinc finger protein 235-like isoform X2 [Nerophis ophidion]